MPSASTSRRRLTKLTSSYIVRRSRWPFIGVGRRKTRARQLPACERGRVSSGARRAGDAAIGRASLARGCRGAMRAGARGAVLIGLVGRGIQLVALAGHARARGRAARACATPMCCIDFDRLGLPDAALGDVLEAARRPRALPASTSPIPSSRRSSRYLDRSVARGGGDRRGQHRGLRRRPARSATTPTAGALPRAFATSMAGVRARHASCSSAPAAAARRSRMRCCELGAGAARHRRSATRRAPTRLADAAGRALRPARWSRSADPRRGARDAPTASSTRRRSAWPNIPGIAVRRRALLARGHWVADIVYFPPETELLRRARALGCRTLAGTGMAVFQAVRAFELFTGIAPDRDAMAAAFRGGRMRTTAPR